MERSVILKIEKTYIFIFLYISKNIISSITLQNSDCDNKSTKHIDAFLYDDEEVDELIEKGELNNLYCSDCGSTNVKQYSKKKSIFFFNYTYIYFFNYCLIKTK